MKKQKNASAKPSNVVKYIPANKNTPACGVSRDRAAELLGDPPISPRTVDRMLRDGRLRGYRVGSRVFVYNDSIDEMVGTPAF
jgi:excisionase family DNA binding protein